MNMTKLDIKLLAKLLIFILSITNFVFAKTIIVKDIYPVNLSNISSLDTEENSIIYTACLDWKLTKQEVKNLFLNSEFYGENNPYSQYVQTNCDISGTVNIDDIDWFFSIDGGGMITTTNLDTDQVVYWGCKKKCDDYVILYMDSME